jgi:hypothetical protein
MELTAVFSGKIMHANCNVEFLPTTFTIPVDDD